MDRVSETQLQVVKILIEYFDGLKIMYIYYYVELYSFGWNKTKYSLLGRYKYYTNFVLFHLIAFFLLEKRLIIFVWYILMVVL